MSSISVCRHFVIKWRYAMAHHFFYLVQGSFNIPIICREIVPTDIPKGCAAIEPWRRYRDWHRPGKCMAPLVMESSRGEICHDGRLTEKLRRSSLFLPERSFGDNPRILAHVNHKTNYRRHSGTKERHMLALRLREIIDNGVYRIPIFERSE